MTVTMPDAAASGGDGPPTLDQEREGMHRRMLSSVSHDLKTPLASIIGSLEVYERMRHKLPEDRQQTLIKVALQEAYRLDAFITNILDMAKFDSNLVKVQRESVELESLINGCTMRLSHRLQDCDVHVDMKAGRVSVMSDPTLLGRALMLILDNAVKYGGSPAVIMIDCEKEGNNIVVSIRDNGRGIADGAMESIFSKYTRFATQDKQTAGTGLGLAICREIMTLLGGTVTAANHSEGGAIFTLRIPME